MNLINSTTNTVQNTINTNNNEAHPEIRVLDTLCVDKYLNPTENKEYIGFTTRDNMILLLNNIDQKINIPKDFTEGIYFWWKDNPLTRLLRTLLVY